MDLHRLRVVGFDTSVNKKTDEKYNVEHEKYEQGDWKSSTHRNNDEIGDVNQCGKGSNSPPRRLSNKFLRNKNPPETSKVFLGDNSTPLGAPAKINPDHKLTRPGTLQKRRPGTSNKCRPGTSKKYLDDISITSPPATWKKRSFTIRKSKSEIFKIPPKKNSIKYDLKLNLSDTDPTEQFQDNAYSCQRKRTLNLRKRNSRVHQKVQKAKESRDTNDVHFLYTGETPSFMRFCRKRAENEKTKTKNKRNCRLPNDIYGFHKSNRSLDQHLYQMSCFKFIDTTKLPLKKIKMIYHRNRKPQLSQPVEKCFCKHHAMRVLKSDHGNYKKPSIYYNLNTRPHSRRFQRNDDYEQEQGGGKKPECLQCMGKDETVEVSPSELSPAPPPIGFCDAGTTPSNVEQPASSHPQLPDVPEECLPPQTATVANEFCQKPSHPCLHNRIAARSGSAQNKCKKERTTSKNFFIIFTNGCKGLFSKLAKHIYNFHSKRELSGAGCVKYVCLGLLIVIWFPCMLAGVLAWVVFFPGKLINMVKCTSKRSFSINRCRRKDPRSEYQRMCFENYLPQQKTSFISSVARWCTRTVGTVLDSFKAVISVFKFKRKEPRRRAGSSYFYSSQIPRKRYTLFYVKNRGWVMKRLRRRKKCAVPRSRVMQNMRCDVIPKMTFFDNWQQTPPPSKEAYFVCPTNKTRRKKRRRSSRAADACQLRCTDQWPSCACGHENPPGLTQVNIPSIFSRSADEILSKNEKKCNSKVLADYIAQEDFAKNHLGQSKSGTWPFGFNFNYTYGTKHPLIMNLETYGANQFGLDDDDKIAYSSKGFINSMQSQYIRSCKLNRLQTQAVNRWIDSNYPSRKNRITVLTNKKLCSQRKNLPMRNKSVLGALSKSALIKDPHTSTHKINYAHKSQNTLKHIPYQKVINKCNKIKNSNLNLTTTKKAYKCKYSAPTQKSHLSTAKIKSSVKPNTVQKSSCINLNNLPKRGGEYKPYHIAATQKQAITINTNKSADHIKALHNFCSHNQYKQGDQNKQHSTFATHIQSNTERNIALHRPSTYNQSKQSDKERARSILPNLKQSNTNRNIASHHPHRHQIFKQATHKQSNISDIMAKVNRKMALVFPHVDKRLYQTRHKPVAIQMKPDTTNNMTMTSRDVVLDDPNEQYKQGYRNVLRQIPVATQIQPQIAENATITSHDVALNSPSGEEHEKCTQIYKYQIPYATQIKSQIANKVTMTSQDVALNCPSEKKHEQSQKNPITSRVHRNTEDTRSTFCDSYALETPLGNKQDRYKQSCRYGPRKIPVATQMKPMKADNITMTSRDVALSCHGEFKPSTANKEILCVPRTAEKFTICTHDTGSLKRAHICKPDHRFVAIQKQSNTFDIATMTSDVNLNYVCGHAQSIQAYKYKASNNRDIGSNFFGSVNKELLCIPKTAVKDTTYLQKHSSLEVHPKRNISIQKQDFKIGASNCRNGLATQSTQISRVGVNRSNIKVECECRVTPLQNKADKKTATTHYTHLKLIQVPSHSLQEQTKSHGVSERQNISQTTPFIDKQELTSDPVASLSRPNRIVRETPTSTTDIQKLPWVCKCACYTIPPLSSEIPQHPLIAQQLSQRSPKILLGTDEPKVQPDDSKVIKNLSKSLESRPHLPSKISQATNINVTPQRSMFDKEMEQLANKGETYKSGSAKETSTSKLFDLAASCVCRANHVEQPEAQAIHSQSRKNISKITPLADMKELASNQEAIVTKSSTFQNNLKDLPCDCKCECNFVLPSAHHGSQAEHSSQHALKTALEDKLSVKPGIELTVSKYHTEKETVLKKSTISKFPKTQVEIHKSSSSKEPHSLKSKRRPDAPNIQSDMSKVIKGLSRFPKSPEIATPLKSKGSLVKVEKSLSRFPKLPNLSYQKCPCQVSSEILQDPTSERLYGTRELTTASKKNIKKVDKSLKNFHPIPVCLERTGEELGKCPCPIECLQYPVSEKTSGTTERTEKKCKKFSKSPECVPRLKNCLHKSPFPVENMQGIMPERSRLSIFSRKSSHLEERCFRPGIPVAQSTTRRAPIGLCERDIDIYSVHKSSSQLQSQCSRESQYPSSVNSLVKNVRSSLFSRKLSNQEKVSERPKLSQESNPKQKKRSKNIQSQFSSSQNAYPQVPTTVPSKHTQNSERSSFNLQSKQLIEKLRSITDIKSKSNSCENKHGKKENLGVQTAPIISGKCACWPDKLHQVAKKISHYSRKPVEKISSSQQPPAHQPTQPYKNSHQPNIGTEAHTVNSQCLPIRQPSQVFQLTEKVGKPFAAISQLIKPDHPIPITAGRCGCVGEQNNNTKRSSNNKLQPEADFKKFTSCCQRINKRPVHKLDSLHSSQVKRCLLIIVGKQLDQLLKTDRVLPIIPGRCRCAGERKIKTEHSSNNKLQPPTVSHQVHKAKLRTVMKPELTQRQNDQLKAFKLSQSQPHTSPHTGIMHNSPLHNSHPTRKKPCKCRSFKNEYEQEVWVNSLHNIAKSQSPFQKAKLDSGMYSDFAKNTLRRQHTILQRSEIPQSLKKSQIQLNPQFQHQQILQDQKPEPEIPIHLEKPPPELLQRNWAGDGRNRTAEGGVQQPYPDFNRVSMRYPGQNDPCPPNDESALRRAYKRRPLRYTPPREQKDCRRQNKNVNSQTVCVTKKQMKRATGIRGFCRCLRDAVRDAEREAWPSEFSCNPWVNTLKRKPCFWIYKTCPRAYPAFKGICNSWNAIRRLFTLCLTFCFWSPIALCFYLCCDVICRGL